MPTKSKPRTNDRLSRDQRALTRILELVLWVQQRGPDAFTFGDVREAFPDHYREAAQAERQWTRDKTQLRRLGLRIRKSARGSYTLDAGATRARSLRLTEQEVALLDRAAEYVAAVPSEHVQRHVDTALRKLALAGVPLRGGARGQAEARREAWAEAPRRLPGAEELPGPGMALEVVYPDPETGANIRHRVTRTRFLLRDKVLAGWSDRVGWTHFLLALVRSIKPISAAARPWSVESGWRMGGMSSLVDALGFEAVAAGGPARRGSRRSPVTPLQRSLAVGYMLLNALIEASPEEVPWNKAVRLSGARSREELDKVVQVLEEVTVPSLEDQFGFLAIGKSDDGVRLEYAPQAAARLSLRPLEAAMLIAAARAVSPEAATLPSLSRKLLGLLDESEREHAASYSIGLQLGAPS